MHYQQQPFVQSSHGLRYAQYSVEAVNPYQSQAASYGCVNKQMFVYGFWIKKTNNDVKCFTASNVKTYCQRTSNLGGTVSGR